MLNIVYLLLGLTLTEVLIALLASVATFFVTYLILSKREGYKMHQFIIDSLVNKQDQYILFLDFDSRVILVNKSFEELVGISSHKMIGKKITDLDIPKDIVDAFTYKNSVIEKGKSTTISYSPRVLKNNSSIWLQVQKRSLILDNSDNTFIFIVANDISDKKHVERQLSITQSEYQQLVESAQDIIYRTDLNGNFRYVNSVVYRILGYEETEFLGLNFFDIVSDLDKDRVRKYYQRLYQDEGDNYLEFRLVTKTGENKWMGQSISFIKENGIVIGFQSVCRDISKTKEAEEQLKQAKELAEAASSTKTKFIASLSHEFRTPLNSILGYAQILERSKSLNEQEKEHIEMVGKAGEQLLGMVNEILELSSLETNKTKLDPELINLTQFLSDLNDSFKKKAESKNLKFDCSYTDLPDIIEVDLDKLSTIFKNILDNAVKFTDKGSIHLDIDINHDVDGNAFLSITVKDTGVGISDENLRYIYEPFWQEDSVRYKGTGLGLTLCKRFTEFLNGTIDIHSKVGEGTKTIVKLPVGIPDEIVSDPEPVTTTAAPVNTGSGKIKVLIVDDVEANRTLTKIIIREKGFDYREAKDGKEAIEMFMEYNPNIILMDINMPVMDGVEAMLRIRSMGKKNNDIPIVAITAGGLMADKAELMAKGFSDYILKPFKEDDLIRTIKRFTEPQFSSSYQVSDQSSDPIVTFQDVYHFIKRLDPDSRRTIENALRLQDFQLISNLRNVLDLKGLDEHPCLQKLISVANDYDYLFITKLLKELRDNRIKA